MVDTGGSTEVAAACTAEVVRMLNVPSGCSGARCGCATCSGTDVAVARSSLPQFMPPAAGVGASGLAPPDFEHVPIGAGAALVGDVPRFDARSGADLPRLISLLTLSGARLRADSPTLLLAPASVSAREIPASAEVEIFGEVEILARETGGGLARFASPVRGGVALYGTSLAGLRVRSVDSMGAPAIAGTEGTFIDIEVSGSLFLGLEGKTEGTVRASLGDGPLRVQVETRLQFTVVLDRSESGGVGVRLVGRSGVLGGGMSAAGVSGGITTLELQFWEAPNAGADQVAVAGDSHGLDAGHLGDHGGKPPKPVPLRRRSATPPANCDCRWKWGPFLCSRPNCSCRSGESIKLAAVLVPRDVERRVGMDSIWLRPQSNIRYSSTGVALAWFLHVGYGAPAYVRPKIDCSPLRSADCTHLSKPVSIHIAQVGSQPNAIHRSQRMESLLRSLVGPSSALPGSAPVFSKADTLMLEMRCDSKSTHWYRSDLTGQNDVWWGYEFAQICGGTFPVRLWDVEVGIAAYEACDNVTTWRRVGAAYDRFGVKVPPRDNRDVSFLNFVSKLSANGLRSLAPVYCRSNQSCDPRIRNVYVMAGLSMLLAEDMYSNVVGRVETNPAWGVLLRLEDGSGGSGWSAVLGSLRRLSLFGRAHLYYGTREILAKLNNIWVYIGVRSSSLWSCFAADVDEVVDILVDAQEPLIDRLYGNLVRGAAELQEWLGGVLRALATSYFGAESLAARLAVELASSGSMILELSSMFRQLLRLNVLAALRDSPMYKGAESGTLSKRIYDELLERWFLSKPRRDELLLLFFVMQLLDIVTPGLDPWKERVSHAKVIQDVASRIGGAFLSDWDSLSSSADALRLVLKVPSSW